MKYPAAIAGPVPVVNCKNVLYRTKIVFADLASPCSRREARRINRREAILDVAQASFLEYGYAGTTMSAIAAMLGGSKGTLWSYFPSKDLLFAAVVDRASQEFRQQLSVILNPHDDTAVALGRFAREFLQKVTSRQAVALHRLVVAEAARFPETGRIFHERAVGRTRDLLADYLAGAMARGALRAGEPGVAAQHLLGLCMFGCHQMLMLGVIDTADPAMLDRDAELGVTAFLRGYAA